jgi:type II secretory pathway pseudopilin PulG
VEILMVLMIMGMVGAVLVGGSLRLLDQRKEEDPENALLTIFQDVRKLSVERAEVIDLNINQETGAFVWAGDSGVGDTRALPKREGWKVTLIKPTAENAVLIGGRVEETPLLRLRFYPDGTCDPARVQVQRRDVRTVLTIDPWTAALLPPAAAGGAR